MKAYFATSYPFRNNNKADYEALIKVMKTIFDEENVFFASDKIDIEIDESDDKSILGSVEARQKALKETDVLIAEITDSTAGVGYNIHTALSYKKPVLVLRRKDERRKVVHHPISSGNNRLLTYKEYTTDKEAEEIINQFKEDSKKLLDTKFILIISPEIDKYIQWASDFRRMHKAQIVRNAVEKEIQRDEDYQKYSKEI